ncbi:interleukin-10 receptor subunit beta-like isoform X1 [Gadus chalcogrammus]|uniref:interleukin-10 receptor subunit beta-like isoform X1 n=1 Tax=Gadus chalcogrammus TaxID=1042646 RepID=UPI0024C4AC45|nr:interleukin-10 receptor subunit beta-like isoform X1 [Gadus chalcogrammus]
MRTFLTVITLCCATKVVLCALDEPRNARLTSWNMDLVLRWDPPGDPAVHYTAEFNSMVFKFRPGCVNTSALYCDFTAEASSLTVYGTYIGRVRAQQGQESSVWVESGPLTLDKNTTIGPPNVTLVSHGVHMTINIRDPVFRISKMREVYNQASYNITYWKEGKEGKAQSLIVQQNPVVLSDLEPLSRYCVKVHISTQNNHRAGDESRVTCEKTADRERTPWLEAVLSFVVMVMVVTVVVVAVLYRKRLSSFLCPSVSLPQHFKENVFETSSSPISVAMENYRPPVETYDQVNVMTTEHNTDEVRPLVAEEDQCSARFPTAEYPRPE